MRSLKHLTLFSLLSGTFAATFKSCSTTQIATLNTAIERATSKAYAAIDHLESNPNGSDIQTTWYGTFSTARYNKILTAFKKLAPDLATTFSYDCSCVGEVVYAYPGNIYGDVTVCSVYFNEASLPPAGQHRNQWDVIIHEATHFKDVLGTTDLGYGVEACKEFALHDPEEALSNADNHARFAVEVPPWGP